MKRATCPCGRIFSTLDALLRHAKTCDGTRAPRQEPKPSKYRNRRTPYKSPLWGKRVYDSKVEAKYAMGLDARIKSGSIDYWAPQPRVPLSGSPPLMYRPDFVVYQRCTDRVYRVEFVDVKGPETQRFRDICKLWVRHAKFPLRIVRGKVDEVIEPEQAQ